MFGVIFVFCLCFTGVATLRQRPFLVGCCRKVFLLDTQKEPKRCPLLPIAREARPRGCSPLGTPKMWSENAKAKKCRSAAFFLTPLRPLPIDPSGAKFLIGVGADSISARGVYHCHPTARADMESAPTVNRKFCNKGKVLWRGQDPSLRDQWVRGV